MPPHSHHRRTSLATYRSTSSWPLACRGQRATMLLMPPPRLFFLAVAAATVELAAGLDNGLAQTPPQAWTSWDLCRFEVNASLIKAVALALNSTGLQALGWNTLQIDEGWEACAEYSSSGPFDEYTTCKTKAPRDAKGAIVANSTKFPGGIKPLAGDRIPHPHMLYIVCPTWRLLKLHISVGLVGG